MGWLVSLADDSLALSRERKGQTRNHLAPGSNCKISNSLGSAQASEASNQVWHCDVGLYPAQPSRADDYKPSITKVGYVQHCSPNSLHRRSDVTACAAVVSSPRPHLVCPHSTPSRVCPRTVHDEHTYTVHTQHTAHSTSTLPPSRGLAPWPAPLLVQSSIYEQIKPSALAICVRQAFLARHVIASHQTLCASARPANKVITHV